MNAPLYTVDILRLAASLPEPARLDREDGKAEARSPTCGSVVSTSVQLAADGRVDGISQTVQACAFGQASAALVAQQAPGRSREDIRKMLDDLTSWLSGEHDSPPDWPGFEALSPARGRPARHPAILLPLRALDAAMKDSPQ